MTNNVEPVFKGLRVVVTRPQHQAAKLCKALEVAGASVTVAPAMQIMPLQDAKRVAVIRQKIEALASYDIVIFVSVNAAELALDWFKRLWPELPGSLRLFTVGLSTADYLQKQGLKADFPSLRMDSEGLLALPSLQTVTAKRVLIFRGQGGRELIAETLEQRGAIVDSCELYARQIPADTGRVLGKLGSRFDVLLVNSAESLRNILSLVEVDHQKRYKQKYLVVPGDRVAAKARALGFSNIITAANATDQAVFTALQKQIENRGVQVLLNN